MNKMKQIERFLADSKSPVQLVKHWDDVKEKPEYPLVLQAKLDGVYSLIVKEHPNVQVFTRTGKRMYKEVLTLEDDVLSTLSDGVFIAELICVSMTLIMPAARFSFTCYKDSDALVIALVLSRMIWLSALLLLTKESCRELNCVSE